MQTQQNSIPVPIQPNVGKCAYCDRPVLAEKKLEHNEKCPVRPKSKTEHLLDSWD